MQEIEITTTVKIKENGKVETDTNAYIETPDDESYTIYSDDDSTAMETERQELVSDLANICEYLTDSEVIKIRLIISKAEKRR